MDLKDFIVEHITPVVQARVFNEVGLESIQIGQSAHFKDGESRAAVQKIRDISKEVAKELEDGFEEDLKEAFLDLKTLRILTSPLNASEQEETTNLSEAIQKAEEGLKEAERSYSLAVQASTYVSHI